MRAGARRGWAARVAPDDVSYYAADGLLNLTYPPSTTYPVPYPLQFAVSPLLAEVSTLKPGPWRPTGTILRPSTLGPQTS